MPPKNAVAVMPKKAPVIVYYITRTERPQGHYSPGPVPNPANGPFHACLGPVPANAQFPIILDFSSTLGKLIRDFEKDATPYVDAQPTPLVQLVRNAKEFNRTLWYSQAREKVNKMSEGLQKLWKIAIMAKGFRPNGEAVETAALLDLYQRRQGVNWDDPKVCEGWFAAEMALAMIAKITAWNATWTVASNLYGGYGTGYGTSGIWATHVALLGHQYPTYCTKHKKARNPDGKKEIKAPKAGGKAKKGDAKVKVEDSDAGSDDDEKPTVDAQEDDDDEPESDDSSELVICGSPVWRKERSPSISIKNEDGDYVSVSSKGKGRKRARSATATVVAGPRRSAREFPGRGNVLKMRRGYNEESEDSDDGDDFQVEVLEEHQDAPYAGPSPKRSRK
ncbi:hypothetical protein RQP46_010429 [Phenoliferia psychrophenolica]